MSIWGKIVGGAAGAFLLGPLGALIGVAAGHAYDRKRAGESDTPRVTQKRPHSGATTDERQVAFTLAVVALAAKMAKADGVVTKDEIAAFRSMVHIPDHELGNVARLFNEAKVSTDGYEAYARQIAGLFADSAQVLEEVLSALYAIACADGAVTPPEQTYLERVAGIFGLSEDQVIRVRAAHQARSRQGRGGGERARGQRPSSDDLAEAYHVLGVKPDASDDAVKAAWRNLLRDNHPDVLMAKGMPAEFVDNAHQKTVAINEAYDRVRKARDG